MTAIGAGHEGLQGGPGDTDAVTFSFGDPARGLFGLARAGLSGTADARRGSALALLFAGHAPVAAVAEGDVPVAPEADWTALELPGLGASVDVPLERWSVLIAAGDHHAALTFEAASPPAAYTDAGGLDGYEQLCRVTGQVVLADGSAHQLDCQGQRGHSWGTPDWGRLEAVHTIGAWMESGVGVAVTALHEAGAKGHGADDRWGALLAPDGWAPLEDARVSTTWDGDGRQRRAGLELWEPDDEDDEYERYPTRAAGTVICGSTLELGQLRLDCAFMRWTMEGAVGVGRYDVLRRA